MLIYILLTIVTIFISRFVYSPAGGRDYRFNNSRQGIVNRICLTAVFLMLFLVSALRVSTGNDYNNYIVKFHDAYTDYCVVTEPGFNWLVKIIYSFFNGEHYLIVFAVMAFVTILAFMKAIYDQSRDFTLSFFLFMTLGFYFQSINTVRYYLALGLVFYSMKYLFRKQYISFIAIVILASLFHKTALIVIPIYLLATVKWKRWQLLIMALLSLTGLFLGDFYLKLLLILYPSYLQSEEYLAGSGISIASILRCILVIGFAILVYKDAVENKSIVRFYYYLNLLALVIYTCFSFMPFLSRISYYLMVSQIVLLPSLLADIKDEKKRKLIKGIIIVGCVLYFAAFLYKAYDPSIKILPYSSWLDSEIDIVAVKRIF